MPIAGKNEIASKVKELTAAERVGSSRLAEVVKAMFVASGVGDSHADIATDAAMYATLRGVTSHGVVHMPLYLTGLLDGTIKSEPKFTLDGKFPCARVMDADNGLGLIASKYAIDHAIGFAQTYGLGAVAVRNSSHFGNAGYYAELVARQGLIALAACNASPALAPTGGKEPLFGTNPIAAAFPLPDSDPIVIDMATTIVARSRIRMAKSLGQSIPIDWAFDKDGQPTTDPERAIEGTLQPIGGPKGYGLALMVELLCGALSDGIPGFEVNYENIVKRPSRIGHFFLVLHPEGFAGLERFGVRASHVADVVLNTKRIDESVPPRLPGMRGHAVRKEYERDGIPMFEGLKMALQNANRLIEERLS